MMRFSLRSPFPRRGFTPRRAVAHALLILALIFAQIGAFTHALSHHASAQGSAAQCESDCGTGGDSSKTHKADLSCALCSAFAGASAALVDHAAAPYAVATAHEPPAHRSHSAAGIKPFLYFSSRAPPACVA